MRIIQITVQALLLVMQGFTRIGLLIAANGL